MNLDVDRVLEKRGRNLTSEEIEDIVNSIGPFPSASVTVSNFMREQHQRMLRIMLQDQLVIDEIVPSLKNHILHTMEYSYISPGEPVGPIAAGAISAPATQMNLSAYHSIGIGGSDPLKALTEIFGLKNDRSVESLFIHFKDYTLTETEAYELMFKLEGVGINDLLDGVTSEKVIEFRDQEDLYNIIPWLDDWLGATGYNLEPILASNFFIRLRFNVNHLYTYKISLPMLVASLEQNEAVTAIPSATIKGIIDVFINPELAYRIVTAEAEQNILTPDDAALMYYNNDVKRSFNNVASKGRIAKLKNVYIKEVLLTQKLSLRERKNPDGTWNLYADATATVSSGISDAKIRKLFQVLALDVQDGFYSSGQIWYKVAWTRSEPAPNKIADWIKSQVGGASEAFNKYRQDMASSKGYLLDMNFPEGELYRAANYCFGIADTDIFKQILANPLIDSSQTILKNPYKVWLTMGIEAARNIIVKETFDTIENAGESIDIRHVSLIADHMCWSGHIIPTTGRGASKLGRETIADATFEKPLDMIAKAAFTGAKETTNSTSTCVFLGKQCALGTGSIQTSDDPEIPLVMFSAEENAGLKPSLDLAFDLSGIQTENTDFENVLMDPDVDEDNYFSGRNESFRPGRFEADESVLAPPAPGVNNQLDGYSELQSGGLSYFDNLMMEYDFEDLEDI